MRTMAMIMRGLFRGAILLGLSTAPYCHAQGSVLRISPGDVVNVHVFDTPELEQSARVNENGDIELSLIGKVHVASLFPDEAAHAIENTLTSRDIMKHPSVTVTVTGYEVELVAVAGEVNRPGSQQITAPRSAIDLITLSGGLTSIADRRNILIRHKGSPTNVTKFFFSNDPNEAVQNDVMVAPGDTILVPRAGIVYVLGDVGRPGGFVMDQPDSRMGVLEAITLAGATNHSARAANCTLIRRTAGGGYTQSKVNFSRIQKGKDPDITLMPGDVFYVPFSYVKNVLALGTSGLLTTAAQAAIYNH